MPRRLLPCLGYTRQGDLFSLDSHYDDAFFDNARLPNARPCSLSHGGLSTYFSCLPLVALPLSHSGPVERAADEPLCQGGNVFPLGDEPSTLVQHGGRFAWPLLMGSCG